MKNFDELWRELTEISLSKPDGSRTIKQLEAGIHAIGKKIIEEAGEVWIAAEYQSDSELAIEISQLLYHLQVLMIARGIQIDEVYKHL